MRYGSVCSGIEAATCAWHPLGWQPQFFSEIDKSASSFLGRKYPAVPNLGDMTKFKEWPDYAIDLLVGGTPCQSFSVAGLRKGLADPRGNLMLTYLAIADRYRPEWLVWENVPGVLSSNGGRDFGTFLGGLGQLGYGFAYRVLDAQYVRVESHPWAVPQRRRRVFVVGCLGGWRRAAAVLFERESLQGHSPPRRKARQGTSRGFETGPGGGSFTDLAPTMDARAKCGPIRNQLGVGVIAPAVGNPLPARMHKGINTTMDEGQTMVAHALRGEGHDASEDGTGHGTPIVPIVCGTLKQASKGSGSENGSELVDKLIPIAFDSKGTQVQTDVSGASPTLRAMGHAGSHQNGGGHLAVAMGVTMHGTDKTAKVASFTDVAGSLRATAPGGQENSSTTAALAVAFDTTQITSPGNYSSPKFGDPSPPLVKDGHPMTLAIRGRGDGHNLEYREDGTANAVMTPNGGRGGIGVGAIAHGWAVRRLTPLECCRLQGFPDDYFSVPGKPFADGPMYKMLGNSMAVNCMRWIGDRIQQVMAPPPKDTP